MPTKTAQYVEFDVSPLPVGHDQERIVRVYGFDEQRLGPRDLKHLSFRGTVREIEGYGKPFGELFQEGIDGEPSLTIGQEAALFNVYLLAKRGVVQLTEPQKAYLNHKFDRIGYGNILQTIVDYDAVNFDSEEGERVRALVKREDSDRRVLLINKPELLVVENGRILEVKGGERKPTLWPANGYVGRTCDGAYTPKGAPIETWPTREQAEATWPQNTEKEREFAADAVSHSYAREEGQGKAFVGRRFFNHDDGRFYLSANWDPDIRNGGVGRSPVSR